MSMKFAFYKGGQAIISRIIRRRTNGEYSHVELVFSDGTSFSSHEAEGGVRFKRIDYEKEAKDWTLIELPFIAPSGEEEIRKWCELKAGKRYDWRAIARFAFGIKMFENDFWFCSEITLAAVQIKKQFAWMVPAATSPQTLYIAARAAIEAVETFVAFSEKVEKP